MSLHGNRMRIAAENDATNGNSTPSVSPVSFGSHNISEGKNEDRGSMFTTHKADGCPLISSFSVFDGHSGAVGASACAHHFNRAVVNRVKKFRSSQHMFQNYSDLTIEDKSDAIYCESIKLSCVELDRNIKQSHKSGCTLNSLFVDVDASDNSGNIRVYCANVGDSRCVLYTHFMEAPNAPNSHFAPNAPSGADALTASASGLPRNLIDPSNTLSGRAKDKVITVLMSQDHKLTLQRERDRIVNGTPLTWIPLPSHIMAVTMDTTADDLIGIGGFDVDLIPRGYPPRSKLKRVEEFIGEVGVYLDQIGCSVKMQNVAYRTSDQTNMMNTLDRTGVNDDERTTAANETAGYRIMRENSYIDFRKAGTLYGAEAIFSRYNLSINMTRSIGDKYAARSVIPIPEITVVTVLPNQFARFVLGSDGIWDVISIEEVRAMVFSSSLSEEVSVMIADEAFRRRIKRQMRMDDISVVVVDVNVHLYKSSLHSNANGGCGKCIIA